MQSTNRSYFASKDPSRPVNKDEEDEEPRSQHAIPRPTPMTTPEVSESNAIESKYPLSSFTQVQLNSSNLMLSKLQEVKEKLDRDDISVTTINTTSTDRMYALRCVSKAEELRSVRYNNLKQSQKLASNEQKLKIIGKQVDAEWLYKRQNYGPTLEDMKVLYPNEPYVELRFEDKRPHGKTGPDFYSRIDPSNLLPTYEMKIYLDDLFGDIGDNHSSEDEINAYENLEREAYCRSRF